MDLLIVCALFSSLLLSHFINMVAFRLPNNKTILSPSSHCMHCKHRLSVIDLVPIISYLYLKGKCRHCQLKISPLYFFGEFTTTLCISLTVWKIGGINELWIAIPFVCFLVTLSISDILYMVIPDRLNLIGFLVFLMARIFIHPLPILDYVLGIFAGGGLLLLLAMISRGGVGGGDIKMMAVVGVAFGWKLALFSLFLASLLGAIVGMGLLWSRVINRGEPIPFGPFLAVASFICYLLGEEWVKLFV